MDQSAAEAKFNTAMVDIYGRTGKEFGYWPHSFQWMVRTMGSVAAAKKPLEDRQVSDGFLKLVKARRMDLSDGTPRSALDTRP